MNIIGIADGQTVNGVQHATLTITQKESWLGRAMRAMIGADPPTYEADIISNGGVVWYWEASGERLEPLLEGWVERTIAGLRLRARSKA